MKVNYFDCKFSDYDEIWTGDEEIRVYRCANECNFEKYCSLDNKSGGEKQECSMAEINCDLN